MTRIFERGQPSFPRPYTAAELEAIAKSIGCDGLRPLAIGRLQEAVIAYQWAKAADEDIWHQHGGRHRSANKRRRQELQNIVRLCEKNALNEVAIALNELDGPTSRSIG